MEPPECPTWCTERHEGWTETAPETLLICRRVMAADGGVEVVIERWATGLPDGTVIVDEPQVRVHAPNALSIDDAAVLGHLLRRVDDLLALAVAA
ncbi:MAG TPA: hypothetical protein VFH56_08300 [Acidimicrobiales bacterium]|nr:hypothetical protein [Acidimicrobiales bacterium]